MGFLRKNYSYIVIAAAFLILLARSFMGFCWTDESFYISTADRFYRGTVPLIGEWYRTQMSSVIMLPFYWVFRQLSGGFAGVVLYFRLLYLVMATLAGIIELRIFAKDYPGFVAMVPALFTMCYAHLNNATFSYYMLSYLFLTLGLCLIYDYKNTSDAREVFIAGVLIALSTLAMPLFAAGYVVIMAAAVVFAVYKRQGVLKKMLLVTFAGTAAVAAVFVIWLLISIDIRTLIETLSYSLVDKEHTGTFGYYIRKPHRSLKEVFGAYTYAAYMLCGIAFLLQGRLKRSPFCHFVIIADTVLFVLMADKAYGHTGYIQVALFIFMIPVFCITTGKNHRLFLLFIPAGSAVALIYCFASSDFLYVMAIGCAVAVTAAAPILYDHVREQRENSAKLWQISGALLCAVCVISLAITGWLRVVNVYRDAPLPRLTVRIPAGVAKGLYTTPEHLRQYMDVCDVINEYCTGTDRYEVISGNPKGNVLFSKILPWGYIAAGADCGYPTTWRATAYSPEQLQVYYTENAGSIPDIIIVLDTEIGSYDAAGDTEDDHNPNLDEMDDYWRDYISRNGFTMTRYKCAGIYGRLREE